MDNIPVGLSQCFYIGLNGFCGQECHLYRDGDCEIASEIKDDLETEEQLELHEEIYGKDE